MFFQFHAILTQVRGTKFYLLFRYKVRLLLWALLIVDRDQCLIVWFRDKDFLDSSTGWELD
jgi:hypothetical protein